ncbi:hypothetical protein HYPSUDRAFT_146864, partial [Hypholoma sublateritium FD-334 SS-4]
PLFNTPFLIVAWIMNECDTIALDGKSTAKGPRGTYTHAQKMRASMTYVFGRIHGLGSYPWQIIHPEVEGSRTVPHAIGNPSVSEQVSTYMVSLRQRKVQSGETPTSARAITPRILEDLYDYNHRPECLKAPQFKAGT